MHVLGAPDGERAAANDQPVESAAALLQRLLPLAVLLEVPSVVSARARTTRQERCASPRYTMHPLVRELAAELLEGSRKQRLSTYRAFIDHMLIQGASLNACCMDVEALNQLLRSEQLNMVEVARVLIKLSSEAAVEMQRLHSCEQLADALFACGMVQQAVPLLRVIVQLQEKALGPGPLLAARLRLSTLLYLIGKPTDAEALGQSVLSLAEQTVGGHNAQTLHAKLHLADILRGSGKL